MVISSLKLLGFQHEGPSVSSQARRREDVDARACLILVEDEDGHSWTIRPPLARISALALRLNCHVNTASWSPLQPINTAGRRCRRSSSSHTPFSSADVDPPAELARQVSAFLHVVQSKLDEGDDFELLAWFSDPRRLMSTCDSTRAARRTSVKLERAALRRALGTEDISSELGMKLEDSANGASAVTALIQPTSADATPRAPHRRRSKILSGLFRSLPSPAKHSQAVFEAETLQPPLLPPPARTSSEAHAFCATSIFQSPPRRTSSLSPELVISPLPPPQSPPRSSSLTTTPFTSPTKTLFGPFINTSPPPSPPLTPPRRFSVISQTPSSPHSVTSSLPSLEEIPTPTASPTHALFDHHRHAPSRSRCPSSKFSFGTRNRASRASSVDEHERPISVIDFFAGGGSVNEDDEGGENGEEEREGIGEGWSVGGSECRAGRRLSGVYEPGLQERLPPSLRSPYLRRVSVGALA